VKYRDDLPPGMGLDVADADLGVFPWFIVWIGVVAVTAIIVLSPDYLNWIG